jgi:hypothetical protein
MRFSRLFPVTLLVAGLLVAACSGGSDGGGASTAGDTIAIDTLPSTTEGTAVESTTAVEETTTTAAAAPVWPLTGLPLADPALANRPAVVVKVGNYDAHPQRGSLAADIIYEEIINANVSRFAFVYHSQSVAEVGPIRSGRRQDVDLFGAFNKPVFAWAGGNKTVTAEVEGSDLVDLSQFRCQGTCFRTNDDSPSEFTLMFNVDKVFAVTFADAGVPPQQFAYRAADEAAAGTPSAGVNLKMDSYKIDWTWNATTGLYERNQNGKTDKDRSGDPLTTNNVVVLPVVYNPGISGSPDAVSTGTGEAWVFAGGTMQHGTWTRADRTQPFTLTDDAGNVMKLTPGRTFIELPRQGDTTPK